MAAAMAAAGNDVLYDVFFGDACYVDMDTFRLWIRGLSGALAACGGHWGRPGLHACITWACATCESPHLRCVVVPCDTADCRSGSH